jgi:energy-coupling factor transporter ATP-binding protein EcfA2
MNFAFSIPTPSGDKKFEVEQGTSILFVGANGGGKTRLAVKIENDLGDRAHRISAHRALTLNPQVDKISEAKALSGLRYGGSSRELSVRPIGRWKQKEAVSLLNDYDFLVQALFAEQSNTSLETHKNARSGSNAEVVFTSFEKLDLIWRRILPHRNLDITGDDIRTSVSGSDVKYPASEMSDGERAIFYLIGQTLTAARNSLIIFDEPELHIHRSIMSRLWDELTAARPDCAMVFISHDLEFVASRDGQKYVLRSYSPGTGWIIDDVPEDTGFSEETTTLILGSRKPILFVEGQGKSLDRAIYRACYPDWTIIPRGSCEEVLHAVVTMRANGSLTRVTCAGIVDADAYDTDDIAALNAKGVGVLPVSEIENLFLLPEVARAIAETEGFKDAELEEKLTSIFDELFAFAAQTKNQQQVVIRYARRRIDRTLKRIDLSAAVTVGSLADEYIAKTSALDVHAVARLATDNITTAVSDRDPANLLRWFDNKGLLSIAGRLKSTSASNFEQWVVRTISNGSAPDVSVAIQKFLPSISAA